MVIYKNANGTTYIGSGKKINKISPGYYSVGSDYAGTYLKPLAFYSTDKVVAKGRQLIPINRWLKWHDGKTKFKDLGLPHKYSMLMAGKPGTGKTVILRELVSRAIAFGYICIEIENSSNYELIRKNVIPALKAHNKEVKVLAIWDDLELEEGDYQVDELKTILDGMVSEDGTFFLFSSNTPLDAMPDALKRPGRLDYIAEFGDNTEEELQELAAVYADKVVVDVSECKTFAEVRGKAVNKYIFDEE